MKSVFCKFLIVLFVVGCFIPTALSGSFGTNKMSDKNVYLSSAQNIILLEAEDANFAGNVILKDGCDNASGNFVNPGNENGNSLTFENIAIEDDGTYLLKIYHFNVNDLQLEVLVNDESLGAIQIATSNWCYQGLPGVTELEIALQKGDNKIMLRVWNNTAAPFLDKIELSDPNVEVGNTTYYISNSTGDDSNDGLSAESPWKSVHYLNAISLGPGDSVLFKCGDVFVGQFIVNGSGSEEKPIYIGSYGSGEKPLIDAGSADGGAFLSAIYIHNQQFIEVEKLELTNERNTPRAGVNDNLAYGIYVHNSSDEIMRHLYFRHLDIRDIFAVTLDGVEFNSIKVAGIGFKSERNTLAGKEKNIQDVLVDSCYFSRTARYGIHTAHGGGDEGIGNDSINRNMNLIFRNNYFDHLGGSGITPGRSYNCLVENNTFDHPGSNIDPRMAARGSGAWFWSCRNVIAQYNRSYSVRGNGDSYGMHIDFGNKNVILQYNYSEDSEGGFVEILGSNLNSVYRFNVSVNDGFRSNKGNSLWVSDFAGTNNRIKSEGNYIYNNTIYVDENITPDIALNGKDTYVYNNIFYATGSAKIGEQIDNKISVSELKMSNNLFSGNINSVLIGLDSNPVLGDPQFVDPVSKEISGFILENGSVAEKAGTTFQEPIFPNGGKGIFKDIGQYTEFDLFGNKVNIGEDVPNIGAYNNAVVGMVDHKLHFTIFPNPVENQITIYFGEKAPGMLRVLITDLGGRVMQEEYTDDRTDKYNITFSIDPEIRNGIYLISLIQDDLIAKRMVVLKR